MDFCTKLKLLFGKMYTIDNIKIDTLEQYASLKEGCKIVVIDDEEFLPYEGLIARNYNVKKRDDIHDIRDIAEYNIIITDIRGVGRRLGGDLEGGAIVKEIKKNYPDKYVIIYSASQFDSRMNSIFHLADDILKKDESIEDWVDAIDKIIKNFVDIKAIWLRHRARLNELQIPSIDIAHIEHLYVSSIINKQNYLSGEVFHNENIKPIIQSIVANYIFSYLTGGMA